LDYHRRLLFRTVFWLVDPVQEAGEKLDIGF